MGFAHALFSSRGPFPVTDSMGMTVAVVMLQRFIAPGKYVCNVPYETVRKFRAVASNIYLSSVKGQGVMVMAKDTKKCQVTFYTTYSDFFEQFNHGLHKQMGDIVHPDHAIAHTIILELMTLVEDEWISSQEGNKLNLALEGAFYVLTLLLH